MIEIARNLVLHPYKIQFQSNEEMLKILDNLLCSYDKEKMACNEWISEFHIEREMRKEAEDRTIQYSAENSELTIALGHEINQVNKLSDEIETYKQNRKPNFDLLFKIKQMRKEMQGL